jgi:hypothetical protein
MKIHPPREGQRRRVPRGCRNHELDLKEYDKQAKRILSPKLPLLDPAKPIRIATGSQRWDKTIEKLRRIGRGSIDAV